MPAPVPTGIVFRPTDLETFQITASWRHIAERAGHAMHAAVVARIMSDPRST